MSRRRRIVLGFLMVLGIIQFIQPAQNKSGEVRPEDIVKVFNASDTVQGILKKACYDCHSNNTRYPWYSSIQPVGWIMAWHIKQAKKQLNFNEFGEYSTRKKQRKLREAVSQIKKGEMPLTSYKLMHTQAALSYEEKLLIIDWMYLMNYNLSIK